MRIPNFRSEEGSILYKNTVGQRISPQVAKILLNHVSPLIVSSQVTSVLDLGCGPGTICLPLASQHPHLAITAVDASASMVALAETESTKLGLTNIDFLQMDAGHIPLKTASFDLVLCNLAFPFFAKPKETMAEIYAVIRPGGTISFTVPGRGTWDEFFAIATTVIGDAVNIARPFLMKFAQAEALPNATAAAGLEEISETRTRIPFHFQSGQAVLDFFAELFHLLDYATPDMQSELATAINHAHPNGFTMHYEAVLLSGRRGK